MKRKTKISIHVILLGFVMIAASNQAFPQSESWTTKTPMLAARSHLAVGVVNGILYAVGGNDESGSSGTVEAYDPVADTWSTKTSMPTPREILEGVVVVNGILYAVGGYNDTVIGPLTTVEAYDPVADTWTTKAPMPTARYDLATAEIDGILYAVGGFTNHGGITFATVEAYDPVADTWSTKTSMPTPRMHLPAVEIDGILYAVGGYIKGGTAVATVEAYDPETDTWTTKAPMPTARSALAAAELNGLLYAVGGGISGSAPRLTTVEAYDPVADTWTTKAPMPTARAVLAADVVNGILYAVGGGNKYAALATVEAYEEISANHPPILDPIGNKEGSEGELLEIFVTATDQDIDDTLTFTASNLPPGSSFSSETAIFSWVPGYDQEGNYEGVEFTVTDNGDPIALDLELITITVGNVNRPPEFDFIGLIEGMENELIEFGVSAIDPDYDTVTLSSGELPRDASFDPDIGLFIWTPDNSQAGNYTVVFYATDDVTPSETGQLEVLVTVGDVPTPPEMADEIVYTVDDLELPKDVENSYMANIKKVEVFIEDGKITPAINQLQAFINKVQNDIAAGDISVEEGNSLIDMANDLLAALTG